MPTLPSYFVTYVSSLQSVFWTMISSLFMIGILAGLWVYWYYNKNYNVWCNILSLREGGAGKYVGDRGAFLKRRDGTQIFRFKKARAEISQPSFRDHLVPATKTGLFIKNAMFFKEVAPKKYVPIPPREAFGDSSNIKESNNVLDFWENVAHQQNRQMYFKPGFMATYGPLLGLSIFATVVIIGLVLILRSSGSYVNSMTQISNNLLEAIKVQGGAVQSTAETIAANRPVIEPPF